jgi:hypothetical protein
MHQSALTLFLFKPTHTFKQVIQRAETQRISTPFVVFVKKDGTGVYPRCIHGLRYRGVGADYDPIADIDGVIATNTRSPCKNTVFANR